MFRDAQEELKRLEAQLLAEEPEEEKKEPESPEEAPPEEAELTAEDLAQLRQLLKDPEPEYEIRNYANHYKAYNTDRTDEDPDAYTQELESLSERRGGAVRILVAILLLAAVIGTVAWWLLRAGGHL